MSPSLNVRKVISLFKVILSNSMQLFKSCLSTNRVGLTYTHLIGITKSYLKGFTLMESISVLCQRDGVK